MIGGLAVVLEEIDVAVVNPPDCNGLPTSAKANGCDSPIQPAGSCFIRPGINGALVDDGRKSETIKSGIGVSRSKCPAGSHVSWTYSCQTPYFGIDTRSRDIWAILGKNN